MSRILRRPMFRGGPVDSRGTGITANLGYNNGGRVGYSNGNLVAPLYSAVPNYKSGAEIKRDAPGIFGLKFDTPFLSIKNPVNNIELTDTSVEEKETSKSDVLSRMTDDFDVDTTSPFEGYENFEDLPKSTQNISSKTDFNRYKKEKEKIEDAAQSVINAKGYLPTPGPEKGVIEKTDKIIDLSNTEGTGGNEEESTELTVKDYVKMLGGDKARRRDTSDLLAKASAAFLGTGDVKEGFAEFMNQVAASGPGRLEKIEQAAASLDIKDKIASKRADEQLKMLLGRDDYQAMLKLRLSDPSLQSFETNLVDTAKSLGKSYKNMGVIGNTINKKYGSGSFGGEVSDDTNYVEGKYYIQDTGTGEKIVFKIVEGKAEEVHRII